MRHKFLASIVLLLCLLLSMMNIQQLEAQNATGKLLGNKTLPDITIQDINGRSVNISEYGKNSKITIISFWATWCAPCKKELNNISDIYSEWEKDYNVELVAVSIDDSRNSSRVKTFVNGQGWEFQVLLDPNQSLKRSLNFQIIPYVVLVDQNGNIVYTHTGYVEGDEYILEDHIKELSGK